MDVIKGKTSCGYEFSIPLERFGNYKTLKMLKESDKDPTKVIDIVPRILGEDGEEALIEALGGEPSFVDIAAQIKEIFEIAKENNDAKKSSPLPN